jgi:hypothetical protein
MAVAWSNRIRRSVRWVVRETRLVSNDVRLDLEETGLYRDDSPEPPQQRGKPQHELALDGRPRVVVCDDRGLECPG